MLAFIVRPFGVKNDIDFDKVDKELIQPALLRTGITGATTAAIIEQGNIREDMFAQLLLADLVIADLSIHNANVFYELGIRHALRDKRTVLIRCQKDDVPFDLLTDRYIQYRADNPANCTEALVASVRATLLSDKADSPVFYLLPKLEAQDPERFLAVPPGFIEEVERARAGKHFGKLALLATEARGFSWELPALRMIGEVQFDCKYFEDAQTTWENIRSRIPDDIEASDRLATLYQRLADAAFETDADKAMDLLAQSDLAIKRLIVKYSKLDRHKRAEIYSLKARNTKSRWIYSWTKFKDDERGANALQSPYLQDAYKDYERAYSEDLNHTYSGINALGLLTVIISLAEALPNVWELEFDTKEESDDMLSAYKDQQKRLATMVEASIEAEYKRLKREDKTDPWVNITEADLKCLTLPKPERVKNLYSKVLKYATSLNYEAAQRQLQIYEQLNVMTENVKAALAAFETGEDETKELLRNYFVFTGHMIDKPDRKEPRFPAKKAEEVKAAIKEQVKEEQQKVKGEVVGLAGGACGGDILFHEACAELGIPTRLFLAFPRDQFVEESVAFAGPDWIERFDALNEKLPGKCLSDTKELPPWLQKKPNYTVWERNNLWILYSGLVNGADQTTLFALWDGKGGDGPGGTDHMLKEAKSRGAKTVVIDINEFR